jgi:Mrp family chromosome partitioning ATPase
MSTSDPTKLARRLSKVKHILLVLSGKGGVGKSSISVQVALSLLNDAHASTGTTEDGRRKPARIGLLDIDLTGPSIPRMLGLDGASIHQSNDGWVPVYLPIQHLQQAAKEEDLSNQQDVANDDRQQPEASTSSASTASGSALPESSNGSNDLPIQDELKVMSIGFLLKDSRQAVVWRGPKKSAMIRQFLADVRWGELDWLIIDTPPG